MAGSAFAQAPFAPGPSEDMDLDEQPHVDEPVEPTFIPDIGGLPNFLEFRDLGVFFMVLALAAALGALIGHIPKYGAKGNSLESVETPKICILYSVVGAVIGAMVQKYGMVIGFVIFGIGGLFRFRSNLGTARKTVRVILATLIGLSCGLHLPHMATGSALFAFALLYMLDRTATYRILIKSLPHEDIPGAATAYRDLLESAGCLILTEKKSFIKNQVNFSFRVKQSVQPDDLEHRIDEEIPENLRGAVDWGTNQ